MEPTQAHPCTARQLHDLCEASCQVQRASENNIAGQLLRQKNITGSLAPQWTVCIGRFFFKITEQNPSLGKASFVQYTYLERLGGNLMFPLDILTHLRLSTLQCPHFMEPGDPASYC